VSPTGKTVALVVRGPAWREDAILREQDEIGGHLALMVRLSREGVIEAAGPFATADERLNARFVGLVVFADANLDTAKRLLAEDSARAAGTIDYEVVTWHL
jgi:uncharacterized protein YciI